MLQNRFLAWALFAQKAFQIHKKIIHKIIEVAKKCTSDLAFVISIMHYAINAIMQNSYNIFLCKMVPSNALKKYSMTKANINVGINV